MSLQSRSISCTNEYLLQLKALVPEKTVLASAGYIVDELSPEALELKKRCRGCGKPMSKFKFRGKRQQKIDGVEENAAPADTSALSRHNMPSAAKDTTHTGPSMRCRFHSGILKAKIWSCCGAKALEPPCTAQEFHSPRLYKKGEIETLWQYHQTPKTDSKLSHRHAVAIDCEMGTAVSGDSELIRVTLLDFFSGQVLIDKLVYPDVPMLHFNTRYSGVRANDLNRARRAGTCFFGRDKARDSILEYVGVDTLVIGHSTQNDLTSLRWIHLRVVDTFILESAVLAVQAKNNVTESLIVHLESSSLHTCSTDGPTGGSAHNQADGTKKETKGSGRLSLKTLSKNRLDRDIQTGKNGHDSVEDALAARDLVHAYMIATNRDARV